MSAVAGSVRIPSRSRLILDPVVIGVTAALLLLGLVMVTSASVTMAARDGDPFFYLERQLLFALVGAGGGTLNKNLWGFLPRDGELFSFQAGAIRDLREVIALVEAGLVRNETEHFPFSRVEEAYDRLHHGTLRGRAVVTPDIWA